MDAVRKHRIQTNARTPLQDVIPLATPFVVYLDPSSACNLRCKFCPTGEREEIAKTARRNGIMDFEVFKKAVDDLSEFESPVKALKLYKDGEPLLNKRFVDMVAYAKASGRARCIETTTNGALLTPDTIDRMIGAGLDRINISVYGMSDEDFLRFSRATVDFRAFVANIRYLYAHRGTCKVHIKTNRGIFDSASTDQFHDTFAAYCDSIDIENISPFWPGYDFRQKYGIEVSAAAGTFGQALGNKLVCPYLFYALAVNSDGSVDLCSCDWTHDYLLGDLRQRSLKQLWNSKMMFDERVRNLKGLRSEHPLCAQCREIVYESVDDIDPYRQELLERLLKDEPLAV